MVENSHNQAGYSLPSEFLSYQHLGLQASDNHQLPTEFPYDFASFTYPPQHADDDFFTGLNRRFAFSTLLDSNKLRYAAASKNQKKWSLSSSPQSILSPALSNGSPTGPFQGPSSPTGPFAPTDYIRNLICEAGGQINICTKLKNQQGFRTNRALLCSANNCPQHHSSSPHPCLYCDNYLKKNCGSIWAEPQTCEKGPRFVGENGCGFGANVRCGNSHNLLDVNGFMGDNSLVFPGGRKNNPGGVKKKCAGTGVFLPRRGPDPVDSRGKSGSTSITQQRGAEAQAEASVRQMEERAKAQARSLNDEMTMRRNARMAQQWRISRMGGLTDGSKERRS